MPAISPYVHRYALPWLIVRGEDETLDVSVRARGDGTLSTVTSGTFTLLDGGTAVLDSVAVTTTGPPAAYNLAAATTATRSLSDRLTLKWSLVIGGSNHTFTQPGHLVRNVLHETLTDDDLIQWHSDLADLRDPDQTSYSAQRQEGWIRLQRMIFGNSHYPHLIIDDWALRDVHACLTLAALFRDWSTSTGTDGRYAELAEYYETRVETEFRSLKFRYDDDEDGAIDGTVAEAAIPLVYLSRPWGWQ